LPSAVDERVLISTHVDTIQVLLRLLHRYQDSDLKIMGRIADTPDQIDRILDDPLVGFFIRNRAHERGPQLDTFFPGQNLPKLSVKDSSDQPFITRFYNGIDLVSDWEEGLLTPNHLLTVFGGATELILGSDVLDEAALTNIGDELCLEVWENQIRGTTMTEVQRQTIRRQQLVTIQRIVDYNYINNISANDSNDHKYNDRLYGHIINSMDKYNYDNNY